MGMTRAPSTQEVQERHRPPLPSLFSSRPPAAPPPPPPPSTNKGVLSQELGSSALFVFLVAILSVTFALLFTFRKPYLECVEITNRRKAAVAPAGPSSGTTTSAAR